METPGVDNETYEVTYQQSKREQKNWEKLAEDFYRHLVSEVYTLQNSEAHVYHELKRSCLGSWDRDNTSLDLDCEAVRTIILRVLKHCPDMRFSTFEEERFNLS